MMRRLRFVPLAMVTWCMAVPAHAQTEPGSTRDTAVPLNVGQTIEQHLDPNSVNWYSFETADEADYVRVRVTNPGDSCAVWATLITQNGNAVASTVVGSGTSEIVTAVVAQSGAVFLRVDAGPYAVCAGTDYSAEVVAPVPIRIVAPKSAARSRPGKARAAASPEVCAAAVTRKNALLVDNQWVHSHRKPWSLSLRRYHRGVHTELNKIRNFIRTLCPGWS
jgi:hypothetical protein